MSGFHTVTICADCDPPVVAISTGHGSRCPRCGQVEEWSLRTTDAIDTLLDGSLARQVIADTAFRSDGDARLLAELAGRLLDRAGKSAGGEDAGEIDGDEDAGVPCPHCVAGEPSVWDGDLFHYAHPDGDKLKFCHVPWRARCHQCSADAATPDGEFCALHAAVEVLMSDRDGYQDGLVVANNAAERRGRKLDLLRARVEQLEIALSEALAEWEASEYRGRRVRLTRLPQLRDVLAGKAPRS